jgi:undecaprenyl-diphosphatase
MEFFKGMSAHFLGQFLGGKGEEMVFEEVMVNQFLQSFASPMLTLIFKLITYFGHPAPWFFIAAILFWMGKEKKSFTLASLILFSGFFAGALKQFIARPRPGHVLVLENELTYSMPSGHSTIAAAIASYAWIGEKIQKNFKYLLILLALLTGISRIYLGAHYLSDVIAGLLLGTIIGWFVSKLEAKINKMHFHITKLEDEFLIVIFFILVILFYLFIPAEFYGAFALLGYFTGYGVFKHTAINLTKFNEKQLLRATILGTIILAILGAFAYFSTETTSQILFFISGLFITIIWPAILNTFLSKKQIVKREKLAKNKHK